MMYLLMDSRYEGYSNLFSKLGSNNVNYLNNIHKGEFTSETFKLNKFLKRSKKLCKLCTHIVFRQNDDSTFRYFILGYLYKSLSIKTGIIYCDSVGNFTFPQMNRLLINTKIYNGNQSLTVKSLTPLTTVNMKSTIVIEKPKDLLLVGFLYNNLIHKKVKIDSKIRISELISAAIIDVNR